MEPTELLERDHREVESLFRDFAFLGSAQVAARQDLFLRLKQELQVHGRIEEKLFYPALRSIEDEDQELPVSDFLRDRADMERLLADLSLLDPGDPGFDRTMKRLQRAVEKHVDQEERWLFPRARKLSRDPEWAGLAIKMETLRKSLNGGPRFRSAG